MEAKSGDDQQQPQEHPAAAAAAAEDSASQQEGYASDDSLSAIDKQYATLHPALPRRIHILGSGSIGKLVAHSLRSIAKPPDITLIFHRPSLIKAWEEGRKVITVNDDGYDVARGGFEVELQEGVRREHGVELKQGTPSVYDIATDEVRPHEAAEILDEQQKAAEPPEVSSPSAQPETQERKRKYDDYISHDPIHNLIVTTKAGFTISALSSVKHRLSAKSTICFLQNGMGVIDDVNKELFPDATSRPNYMQGIITHGANVPPEKAEKDPFYVVHAGAGSIALGLLPRDDVPQQRKQAVADAEDGDVKNVRAEKWAASSRYLLRTLTRSPVLCAVGFTPTELLQQQLEKLVANSIVNPLTSLLDNRNGSLLYNFALTRTMRLMIAETSHVIRSLPELQSVPNVNTRFSPERCETLVISVANKTKDNISSMLADVRAGRRTEIDYINGYLVRRGEEIGIKCVVNYAIMQTVIGKSQMVHKEKEREVPVEDRQMRSQG